MSQDTFRELLQASIINKDTTYGEAYRKLDELEANIKAQIEISEHSIKVENERIKALHDQIRAIRDVRFKVEEEQSRPY